MARWLCSKRMLLLFAAALLAGHATAQERLCAIVALHGKWGNPQQMTVSLRQLDPPCTVKAIELPWSGRREYDADYPHALQEIAAQVHDFRSQGYRHVLLVGHSFGANAALAYGAEIGDVDGLVLLAPGHVPRAMYKRGISRAAVEEARQLVAAGKGDQSLAIDDVNQGRRRSMRMKASVLLSYFEPRGLGDMPTTTARLKPGIPLLWVVGTADPLYRFGTTYAYDSAPANPRSRFVTVEADHMSTPEAAIPATREWIQQLLAQ